jgi:flagellar FliL protein
LKNGAADGANSRPQIGIAFCPAGCVRLTPAGVAMATTNDKQTEEQNAEAEGEEGKAAPAKRKFSLKLILIAVGGVVALGAVGGGGYYFLFGHKNQDVAAAEKVKPPVFLDMPDVLVNLSSTGASDRTQYLKVKVVLELPDQEMSTQIQPMMPRIMDTFQTYLRELRPTDLDGSAGLYRLKEELTRRVDAAIAPNKINAVLFKEIVIQ